MLEDTWLTVFMRQWGTGKYWTKLMGESFKKRKFLEYEDALYIGKKAQSDGYKKLIEKFKGTPYENVIPDIELMESEIWNDDIQKYLRQL